MKSIRTPRPGPSPIDINKSVCQFRAGDLRRRQITIRTRSDGDAVHIFVADNGTCCAPGGTRQIGNNMDSVPSRGRLSRIWPMVDTMKIDALFRRSRNPILFRKWWSLDILQIPFVAHPTDGPSGASISSLGEPSSSIFSIAPISVCRMRTSSRGRRRAKSRRWRLRPGRFSLPSDCHSDEPRSQD
jgi:hypothetical protein